MNRFAFFIFFAVFFSLYFLLHRFLYIKGLNALADTKFQYSYRWIFWILAISFVVGQFLERGNPTSVGRMLSFVGSIWVAWFLYLLLFTLLMTFITWVLKMMNISLQDFFQGVPNRLVLFWSIVGLSLGIVTYGFINARNPVVRHFSLKIDKKLEKPLTVALVSDLHLGNNISRGHIQKMVKLINENNPDLVLIAGDLVDHNPKFAIKDGVGEDFLKIKAPLGIFAITGNHEYIGDAEMSINYLSKFGVHYLRDTMLTIDHKIQLIGREDRQKVIVTQQKRKTISTLTSDLNRELPSILLDHQPVEYQAVANENIDLMVSGHTHKGQLFPLNFITQRVFENHYGLLKKQNTWFYTTNGFGTWGPPVRVGNTPEVVIFTLKN